MGLPYAAGFYSKEFLVEQVSKDSTISFWVRSMWSVSFICTPIYMFKLTDNLLFGWRRSAKLTYWDIFRDFCFNLFDCLMYSRTGPKWYYVWQAFQRSLYNGKATAWVYTIYTYYICNGGAWIVEFIDGILWPADMQLEANLNYIQHNVLETYKSPAWFGAHILYGFIIYQTKVSAIRFSKSFFKSFTMPSPAPVIRTSWYKLLNWNNNFE